jgi:hypothetical protein
MPISRGFFASVMISLLALWLKWRQFSVMASHCLADGGRRCPDVLPRSASMIRPSYITGIRSAK